VILIAKSLDAPVSPINAGAAYGSGSTTPSVIVIRRGAASARDVKLIKIITRNVLNSSPSFQLLHAKC
jgi:hypothetical protein